jgi:hypothetical protein
MGLIHSPRTVTDGLVLHLDAANVKSYPGSGTTWYDMSGNGNNAILSGSYSFDSINKNFHFNSGSQLDGNGRATINFPFPSSASPYTIECIFRINRYKFLSSTTNISAQIFSSGRATGNYDEAFYLGRNAVNGEVTNAGFSWYDVNAADGPGGSSYNFIYTGSIYHGSVTIENPGTVNFYINGDFSVSDTTNATDLRIDGEWSISNQPPGIDQGVDSNFYNVKVYNRVLTPAEIKQNFNALRGRFGL